jgi:hypothetical protein
VCQRVEMVVEHGDVDLPKRPEAQVGDVAFDQ